MKKTIKTMLLLLIFTFTSMQAGISFPHNTDGGYFDITVKNNCSKEVELRVRADGSSSTTNYKAGESHKVPVKEGYELYVDGKLYLKLQQSDSGKEIGLCK